MIDLHAHSTCSDGSLTPEALAARGAEAGLNALALTDHDTTAGVAAFLAACEGLPMDGVGGVEISAAVPRGTLHMLGYFVDPGPCELQDALAHIRGGREERNRTILANLNKLGFELTWEDVKAFSGDEVMGRPHFAQALMAGTYVRSKTEAFDRYLGKGKPAYADRFRLPPAESVALIAGAGGAAVLAHPFTLDLGPEALDRLVAELRAAGLAGIEAYYPEHSPRQREQYLALAEKHGLVATGGSDFHGELNPDIRLGVGFGSLHVPDEVLDALRAHRP